MRILSLFIATVLVFPIATAHADGSSGKSAALSKTLNMKDETTRINYSLGFQIGGDFKRQGVEMDAEAVVQGIADALKGGRPQLSQPEMYSVLHDLKKKIVAQQRSLKHDMTLKILAEDKKFLEKNKTQSGVKTTASGLQYKILKPGTGKQPKTTDSVTVNYRGTLINKQEFDSSYERGAPGNFALASVIKGWTEGLQLIKEGGKIQLFIPPELAYGERGPLAHRVLLFDIELLSVKPTAAKEQAMKENTATPHKTLKQ